MHKLFSYIIVLLLLISTKVFAQKLEWSQKANPILNQINSVAFSFDQKNVLSGTDCHPASIRMFDLDSGILKWDYTVGSNYMCIMGVTFSSNKKFISAIEEFGNIFIFDNSGSIPKILDTIKTNSTYGFSTAISSDYTTLAAACSNGKLYLYNLTNKILVKEIDAHDNWVTSVTFSNDGKYIITGGDDNVVKIWDSSGVFLNSCVGHTSDITQVKVSPNNLYIISSSKDKKIKVWDIKTGKLVKNIVGHNGSVNGVDISPDGNYIVSASSDSTLKIWSINDGTLKSTFGVSDSGIYKAVAWSANGDKIVSGNVKSDLSIWSINSNIGITSENEKDNQLYIYPNPTYGIINFLFKKEISISRIYITDCVGQIIKHITDNSSTINTEGFASGLYILKIETEDRITYTKTFIKQ